jgi:SAM-dependent methyltransferase
MKPILRNCPVCDAKPSKATPFLDHSIDADRLGAFSFASRKTPEFMSHAMVRCRGCNLAYVPLPPSQAELALGYHQADYDSAQEAEDAADAYARAIAPVLDRLAGRTGAALEIGTGTGAFLERLEAAGFATLFGVEPSRAVIEATPPARRGWIREGIFEAGLYPPGSFDLICCFMTLEHVRDPGDLVEEALRLLRPGGAFVAVTHDYRSPVNRLLGKRSPIVDVEHMQLFDARSATALLSRRGYADVGGRSLRNSYRASYWLRLTPLPRRIKNGLIALVRRTNLDRRRIALNVGNRMSWGFKDTQPAT